MQAMVRALFLFVLIGGAGAASAQTAQQLLSACRPVALGEVTAEGVRFGRTFETGLCWGTFAMLQEVVVRGDEQRRPLLQACVPASSTRSQFVQVFVKYAEARPERLHEEGAAMALEGLQQAYPCKAKR